MWTHITQDEFHALREMDVDPGTIRRELSVHGRKHTVLVGSEAHKYVLTLRECRPVPRGFTMRVEGIDLALSNTTYKVSDVGLWSKLARDDKAYAGGDDG